MSVSSARGQLKGAHEEMLVQWETAKQSWNDAASRAFEAEFIAPLEPSMRAAGKAMEQMTEVLARVRRECGGEA